MLDARIALYSFCLQVKGHSESRKATLSVINKDFTKHVCMETLGMVSFEQVVLSCSAAPEPGIIAICDSIAHGRQVL